MSGDEELNPQEPALDEQHPPAGGLAPDLADLGALPATVGDEHLDALLAAPVIPDLPPELDPDPPRRSSASSDPESAVAPPPPAPAADAPPAPLTRAAARTDAPPAVAPDAPSPLAEPAAAVIPPRWEGVQDSSATSSPRAYRAWTTVIFAGLALLLAAAIAGMVYLANQPLPFG